MISLPDPALFFETRFVTPHLKLMPANSLSFEELYSHYFEVGFLYPEKLKKLSPHIELIRENWEKGWAGGRGVLWTLVYREERFNKMGTLSAWRTTAQGWQSQHLTSDQHAAGVLCLLLSAQDEGVYLDYDCAQNWYSPTNSFAMKIYGRMDRVLGEDKASSHLLNYIMIDPTPLRSVSLDFSVIRCKKKDIANVKFIAEQCRGSAYCMAEELNNCDFELSRLDSMYQKLGLRRKRFVWIAQDKATGSPKGMVVAHRGPFGFNFSFLENRCDIMVCPELNLTQRKEICRILLAKAARAYFDQRAFPEYPIHHLVVLADNTCVGPLSDLGGVKTRQYYQGIWLNKGFKMWKRYMMRVFSPVIKRYEKQSPIYHPA